MKISVPDSALPFIKVQRTGFKDPRHQFVEALIADFLNIKEFLPKQETISVLDIGCGLAGIDVLIDQHYPNHPGCDFTLIDKDSTDSKPVYGFNQAMSYYNHFGVTDEVLKANNVTNYTFLDAEDSLVTHWRHLTEPVDRFDLVISLLSCGFHYPVGAYSSVINNTLSDSPEAVVIMDIRKGTDGKRELGRHFPDIAIIHDHPKFERVRAKRI